jgi:hypothetical protein
MGTKVSEVVCDEHGIDFSGEYYGDNDAHLDRTNVLTTKLRAASTSPARCSLTSSPT